MKNKVKEQDHLRTRTFRDEKLLTRTGRRTKGTIDICIGESIAQVPVVMRSKHPVGVMVLAAVTGEGDVIPPIFPHWRDGHR